MKKGIILSLLIFAFLSLAPQIGSAQSFSPSRGFFIKPFGGRIISDTALEIETAEAAGYVCVVLGYSISILPMGSPNGTPVSYYIPFTVKSSVFTLVPSKGVLGFLKPIGESSSKPTNGKLILGNYGPQTPIGCVHPILGGITIPLHTVLIYGVSGK